VDDPFAEEVPDALAPQVPVIEAVLDAVGLTRIAVTDFEADDVIGTLAHASEIPVDVVTGDRDLFQLIDDERGVAVLYIGKGFAKVERVTDGVMRERYGVPAASYADFATLRGDPSDGLPGVKGVGDKSAAAVVAQYPTVERLMAALADPNAEVPFRNKLEPSVEYLHRAVRVVRVRRDVPVPVTDARLPTSVRDPSSLIELVDRWGLERPVNRLLGVLGVQV
jgi:5'-3' exonuclease